MTRKSHIAVAAALLLPALPALAYEEAFAAPADRNPRPTPVQVTGHYSDGYALEEPVAARPQAAPAVVGNYTEQFFDPPARASGADARPAPAKVAAKR